jgi:hypothetical protein
MPDIADPAGPRGEHFIEVLRCADCRALAVAINDVRLTGHKCSGRWTRVLHERINLQDLRRALAVDAEQRIAALESLRDRQTEIIQRQTLRIAGLCKILEERLHTKLAAIESKRWAK